MELSKGISADIKHFSYVSGALEKADINYGIWNAEQVLLGTAKRVEFVVRTESERSKLRSIINSAKRGKLPFKHIYRL